MIMYDAIWMLYDGFKMAIIYAIRWSWISDSLCAAWPTKQLINEEWWMAEWYKVSSHDAKNFTKQIDIWLAIDIHSKLLILNDIYM